MTPALVLPPEHLCIPAPGWTAPVQTDLFGQTLLERLGMPDLSMGLDPTEPDTRGNFLQGLLPVRVELVKAPAWLTLFLCCRATQPRDMADVLDGASLSWHSGLAGGIAFGQAPNDRLFYFHGTPHIHAPSASADAAIRHALAEARGMFANYHGAQDAAAAAAAQVITELLRLA